MSPQEAMAETSSRLEKLRMEVTLIRESVCLRDLIPKAHRKLWDLEAACSFLASDTGDNGHVTQDTTSGFDGEEGFTPTGKIMEHSKLLTVRGWPIRELLHPCPHRVCLKTTRCQCRYTVKPWPSPWTKACASESGEWGNSDLATMPVNRTHRRSLHGGSSHCWGLVLVAIILPGVF